MVSQPPHKLVLLQQAYFNYLTLPVAANLTGNRSVAKRRWLSPDGVALEVFGGEITISTETRKEQPAQQRIASMQVSYNRCLKAGEN